ncbi:MAG: TIGR03936 family radical SAM-associated protein [Clostridium sp.]|jgi:radical SAM-linked protein|nr:TIGR03936 family radical SAM-associated protein [Clostridium sp.]
MKLRIKFRKFGAVRFIGHLDVMRFFQKAIRRAGIDVAYSTGFAPHQIMSFAAPLSVGVESNGEYMDITVNQAFDSLQMIATLNRVSVPGIEVSAISILPDHAENAMSSVVAASYQVLIHASEGVDRGKILQELEHRFKSQESIIVQKKTKKGTREMDVKPGIFSFSITADGTAIELITDASSAGNVKPTLLMEALSREPIAGYTYPTDYKFHYVREDLFTAAEDGLVSLSDIGICSRVGA